MIKLLFWDMQKKELVEHTAKNNCVQDIPEEYLGWYCADLDEPTSEQRYGLYQEVGWYSVDLSDFPSEFRTYLLLMEHT